MKKITFILAVFLMSGCVTTQYPVYKNNVFKSYTPVERSKSASRQTKSSVTITDLGQVTEQIVPPVYLQACDGEKLLVKSVTINGTPAYKEVMETVDPFSNIHVRRVKIVNNTKHTITLGTVDAILVDPNGNDHEMSNRGSLERIIRAKRPCSSTGKLVSAFDSVPFLANQIKVRPGRDKEVFVPFPNKKNLDMRGEWSFQLLDFPTGTSVSGAVSKRDAFTFPIVVNETETTVRYKKDGMFSQWTEIERQSVPVK